ncbi:HlyD family secretion protein [Candidatus Laterigemmans baculatus]|uniref:HlyD family secretion protein n=1 Tax=Candidatus Laterigemmans baculatus TaxID=2770505 RepID=UPI0013DB026E|nr:HlyD family efflux transporter periplasmic adaptor subunit [Candidatus Laterigemmans baculatus]
MNSKSSKVASQEPRVGTLTSPSGLTPARELLGTRQPAGGTEAVLVPASPRIRPLRTASRLVQSRGRSQRLARWLLAVICLAIVALAWLPWQQSARGTGSVIALNPQERQQPITSPVKGLVLNVSDGLTEGASVREGDVLLEIQPLAADLAATLELQTSDYEGKLANTENKIELYGEMVRSLEVARDFAVSAAEAMVQSAEAKLRAKQQTVPAYESKALQTEQFYNRNLTLFRQGVKPEKEVEKAKQEWDLARAELAAVQSEVQSAQEELRSKQSELEQKRSEAQSKVDQYRAMVEGARGDLNTLRKEMRDLEIKRSELDRLVIRAPRDGKIFRLPVFERGQAVKEGDYLLTLVPDFTEPAVELWVAGNDMPLVRPGDHVRLQFQGWPAVQFSGWPSVAVGTFAGEVIQVDPADDGQGNFRVVVGPTAEEDWPDDRYLRQGVRANGWVMLRTVSLGYELWRQMNGFPPVVAEDAKGAMDSKPSKPKLPK